MTNSPGEPASSDALPPEPPLEETSGPIESPVNAQSEAGEAASLTASSADSGGEGVPPFPPFGAGQAGDSVDDNEGEEVLPEISQPEMATVEVVRNATTTDEPEANFDIDFLDERIEFSQEETRAILAKSLIFLFAGTIGAAFIYIFVSSFIPRPVSCLPARIQTNAPATGTMPSPAPSPTAGEAVPDSNVTLCSFDNSAKDLITLILNSLTAIIGTALGFYFGTQTKGDRANNKAASGDRQSTE